MNSDQSRVTRKRRRPPKSCLRCRARKVRCDQNLPCNQCTRMKLADCSYDPQTIEKRIANRVHKFGPQAFVPGAAPPTPASTTITQEGLQSSAHRPIFGYMSSAVQTPSAGNTENTPSANHGYHDAADLLEDRLLHVTGEMARPPHQLSYREKLGGTVTKTRLLGRSHWINNVQEFPFLIQLQQTLEAGNHGEAMVLLDRCKVLGRTIKSRDLHEVKVSIDARDLVPSRDTADALVGGYFRAFESTYRILHIPSFRREYDEFWESPTSSKPAFVLKLLLVLAIGTSVSDEQLSRQSHIVALQWINAAQTWIGSPFNEKSKLSISGIQVSCLLLLAREAATVSPDLIWISTGSLLRTATLIGLHRDPSHFPRLTAFQSEIRRRLWATVMELCLQASMNAGGPPNISANIHDCRPPLNLNDDDIDDSTSVAAPSDEQVFTQTSLQIALLQTMPLRCKIAKSLNDFRSDPSFSETIEISTELTQSLHQLSARLRTSSKESGLAQNDAGLKMYELMTYRFLMSVHQTYAFKAISDPKFYFARKVCLDASLRVMSVVFPVSHSVEQKSDFSKMIAACSGTVKNVIILAFMMVGLELTTQTDSAQRISNGVVEEMIRAEMIRIHEAFSDYSLARIKACETNVKGYVFSMGGLASIKAMEAGLPVEEAALEASLKATRLSIEILESRLSETSTPAASQLLGEQSVLQGGFGAQIGDDFGWDDWEPGLNFQDSDLFLFPEQ